MKQSRERCIKPLIMCVIPFVCFLILRAIGLNGEEDAKILIRLSLYGVLIYAAYLGYKGRLSFSSVVFLIITSGIILRFGYTLYTHAFVRGHDIGGTDAQAIGHYGYLSHVMDGHLPPSNRYQFYQAPLFYMLSALFIKIAMLFSHKTGLTDFLYMSQLVSCISSSIALISMKKIMDELDISERTQTAAIAVTAFYPSQIYAAGRMNNDALVFMFMMLALYYTIKWHKKQELKYIIGIALTIGFGMMTKINCGIVAFITGPVMLYHFFRQIKSGNSENIKRIIIQLSIFALICFPLGLWYPIRNYIKFEQPFTYVPDLGTNHAVYTGYASFAERWIKIPFSSFIKKPYMNTGSDTNVFMGLIITGVHGEFTWENLSNFLAYMIDYTHCALILSAGAGLVFVTAADRKINRTQKLSVLAVWIISAVCYISFNVSYPYMCSADFRYVFLGQASASVFIAFLLDFCRERRLYALYIINSGIICLFCALSIIHIC